MTRILSARHGQTVWNTQRRFQGKLDSPLTPAGEQEAQKLAERLQFESIDQIICSDLGRAIQTTEIIASTLQQPFESSPLLRERNFGIFEGLTHDELIVKYPKEYEAFGKRKYDYNIPDAEPFADFAERVVNAYQTFAEKHADQTILLVCHGGVLSLFFRHVIGLTFENSRHFITPNCSLSGFRYAGDGRWLLDFWGEQGFLR